MPPRVIPHHGDLFPGCLPTKVVSASMMGSLITYCSRHQLLTTEGTDIGHPDRIVKKLSCLETKPGVQTLTIAVAKSVDIVDTAERFGESSDALAESALSV